MAITSLYKDYFQKSRVFLYPVLGIKRGIGIVPIQTYISWKNNYTVNDAKLMCLYNLSDDSAFLSFEKTKLLNNPLFHDFKQVDDNKGLYIFNFESLKDDWNNVINGKYSKLSTATKNKIKNYTGYLNSDYPYVLSFLEPEKNFEIYADMMLVKVKLLREVGELCSVPDLEKEELEISIVNLEFQKIIT